MWLHLTNQVSGATLLITSASNVIDIIHYSFALVSGSEDLIITDGICLALELVLPVHQFVSAFGHGKEPV